jgi:hypothetical protein
MPGEDQAGNHEAFFCNPDKHVVTADHFVKFRLRQDLCCPGNPFRLDAVAGLVFQLE